MIDARELRIGNLIFSKADVSFTKGDINKVTGITPRNDNPERYLLTTDKGIGDADFFKPIRLTEEWLLQNKFKEERAKCIGEFYQYRYPVMFGNESYVLRRNIADQWLFSREDDFKKTDTLINIFLYVHNLQNIWFELNKEELPLTGNELTLQK